MISRLFVWLCVRWFNWSGWRVYNPYPDVRQYVLVVAPHTSNIDFPVGVAARKIYGLNVKYAAKKELFRFPIRGLLLNLGGYPVDRSKSNSFVDAVVELFRSIDDFAICITPEGTRKKVATWKTGFYHIASQAGVPIIPVGFDYARRLVITGEAVHPSGNMDRDMEQLHRFFSQITPKYPNLSMYSHLRV